MKTVQENDVELLRIDDARDVLAEREHEKDGALSILPLRAAVCLRISPRIRRNRCNLGENFGPLIGFHFEARNGGNHAADRSLHEDVLFVLQIQQRGRFH